MASPEGIEKEALKKRLIALKKKEERIKARALLVDSPTSSIENSKEGGKNLSGFSSSFSPPSKSSLLDAVSPPSKPVAETDTQVLLFDSPTRSIVALRAAEETSSAGAVSEPIIADNDRTKFSPPGLGRRPSFAGKGDAFRPKGKVGEEKSPKSDEASVIPPTQVVRQHRKTKASTSKKKSKSLVPSSSEPQLNPAANKSKPKSSGKKFIDGLDLNSIIVASPLKKSAIGKRFDPGLAVDDDASSSAAFTSPILAAAADWPGPLPGSAGRRSLRLRGRTDSTLNRGEKNRFPNNDPVEESPPVKGGRGRKRSMTEADNPRTGSGGGTITQMFKKLKTETRTDETGDFKLLRTTQEAVDENDSQIVLETQMESKRKATPSALIQAKKDREIREFANDESGVETVDSLSLLVKSSIREKSKRKTGENVKSGNGSEEENGRARMKPTEPTSLVPLLDAALPPGLREDDSRSRSAITTRPHSPTVSPNVPPVFSRSSTTVDPQPSSSKVSVPTVISRSMILTRPKPPIFLKAVSPPRYVPSSLSKPTSLSASLPALPVIARPKSPVYSRSLGALASERSNFSPTSSPNVGTFGPCDETMFLKSGSSSAVEDDDPDRSPSSNSLGFSPSRTLIPSNGSTASSPAKDERKDETMREKFRFCGKKSVCVSIATEIEKLAYFNGVVILAAGNQLCLFHRDEEARVSIPCCPSPSDRVVDFIVVESPFAEGEFYILISRSLSPSRGGGGGHRLSLWTASYSSASFQVEEIPVPFEDQREIQRVFLVSDDADVFVGTNSVDGIAAVVKMYLADSDRRTLPLALDHRRGDANSFHSIRLSSLNLVENARLCLVGLFRAMTDDGPMNFAQLWDGSSGDILLRCFHPLGLRNRNRLGPNREALAVKQHFEGILFYFFVGDEEESIYERTVPRVIAQNPENSVSAEIPSHFEEPRGGKMKFDHISWFSNEEMIGTIYDHSSVFLWDLKTGSIVAEYRYRNVKCDKTLLKASIDADNNIVVAEISDDSLFFNFWRYSTD